MSLTEAYQERKPSAAEHDPVHHSHHHGSRYFVELRRSPENVTITARNPDDRVLGTDSGADLCRMALAQRALQKKQPDVVPTGCLMDELVDPPRWCHASLQSTIVHLIWGTRLSRRDTNKYLSIPPTDTTNRLTKASHRPWSRRRKTAVPPNNHHSIYQPCLAVLGAEVTGHRSQAPRKQFSAESECYAYTSERFENRELDSKWLDC